MVYLIGNAHIDPVWLWQWREGYQEVLATFRSALDRMNENGDFVFTCAGAAYYEWVEQADPDMFAEILRRVAEGRWVLAGGMWIQPDMNAPSGESLARQLMYGQRWFDSRFGKTAGFGYNVDSFGHNGSVPMLLRAAGIGRYVWMRPGRHENPAIPLGPMIWESKDGSAVLAYHISDEYTCAHAVGEKIARALEFQDAIRHPVMCFYGVGNHGGGPTIENLRQIGAFMREHPRGAEARYASPADYFRAVEPEAPALPVWRGELQHHASGCYSAHSESKRAHRRAEQALLRMESVVAMARALAGHRADDAEIRRAWRSLLFNQFHDILGGCCLPEAMDDAVIQLHEAVAIADRQENAALQAISRRVDTSKGLAPARSKESDWSLWGNPALGTPVVVLNPHPFDASAPVRIRRPVRAVRDSAGRPLPCQAVRASRTNGDDKWDGLFVARVPAWGYETFWVTLEARDAAWDNPLAVSETALENRKLRAEFDPLTGGLIHLIDKASGYDALAGASAARLYDIEHCDTWAHGVFKFDREAGAFSNPAFRVIERGPVRAALEVVVSHGGSRLALRYALCRDDDCLSVSVRMSLDERHRMVKLCWPAAGERSGAEIPFGWLERPTNGDEEPCQRWIAAWNARGGLAAVNDGKYSYSAGAGELRLTVANTSLYADHYGQAGRDADCAFMDQGEQRFELRLVPFAGEPPVDRLNRCADLLNRPLPYTPESYHAGPLPERRRGARITGGARVTALKRAEDGGGTILRLQETAAGESRVRLELALLGRTLEMVVPPSSLRSFYLPDDPAEPVREVPLTELEPEGPGREEEGNGEE